MYFTTRVRHYIDLDYKDPCITPSPDSPSNHIGLTPSFQLSLPTLNFQQSRITPPLFFSSTKKKKKEGGGGEPPTTSDKFLNLAIAGKKKKKKKKKKTPAPQSSLISKVARARMERAEEKRLLLLYKWQLLFERERERERERETLNTSNVEYQNFYIFTVWSTHSYIHPETPPPPPPPPVSMFRKKLLYKSQSLRVSNAT